MNKSQIIDFLKERRKNYEERGYIPTIELLIQDMETEEEIKDEANRQINNDKAND